MKSDDETIKPVLLQRYVGERQYCRQAKVSKRHHGTATGTVTA